MIIFRWCATISWWRLLKILARTTPMFFHSVLYISVRSISWQRYLQQKYRRIELLVWETLSAIPQHVRLSVGECMFDAFLSRRVKRHVTASGVVTDGVSERCDGGGEAERQRGKRYCRITQDTNSYQSLHVTVKRSGREPTKRERERVGERESWRENGRSNWYRQMHTNSFGIPAD